MVRIIIKIKAKWKLHFIRGPFLLIWIKWPHASLNTLIPLITNRSDHWYINVDPNYFRYSLSDRQSKVSEKNQMGQLVEKNMKKVTHISL